jgi:hypothetical protein
VGAVALNSFSLANAASRFAVRPENIDGTLKKSKKIVNSAHWLYALSFGLLLLFSIKLIRFLILLAHFFSFFPRSLLHILSNLAF